MEVASRSWRAAALCTAREAHAPARPRPPAHRLAISTLLALLALEGVLSLKSNRLHHPPLLVLHNALWLLVISHALAVYFYSSYSTFGRGPEFALLCSELCVAA